MSVAPEPQAEQAMAYEPDIITRFVWYIKRRMGFERHGFFPTNLEQDQAQYIFAQTVSRLPWKIRVLVLLTGRIAVYQRMHVTNEPLLHLGIETQIYVPWDKPR